MKFRILGIACLACFLLAGCGEPPTYSVSGTVKLGGKPLPDAFVSFIHQQNPSESAVAITDANGNYTLKVAQSAEGMVPGMYDVRISTYREANLEAEPPEPEVREQVPPKYNENTELTAEVIADQENVFEFDL